MRVQFGKTVFLCVLLVLCTAIANLFAQVPTGTILGTVEDAQGLSISGAMITLTNQGTEETQADTSSSLGAFQFTQLNSGLYQIEVSKPGFKNSVVQGIKLDASTEFSVPPILLALGAVTDTITVEAGANLVQTAGAEITDTVETQQIQELPILDRDPLNLLGLQAGVSQNRRSETVINGQRQSFSNITLDGINIQDNYIRSASLDYTPNLLMMSQVGEFTTTTQNAGPQAGLGSSQVSMVTPSGTNQWHGEGFWYYRTGAWAANDWFNDANGIGKPNLLLNQAGGDIGGPVIKNKLFVYGAYELYRSKQQIPTDTTVLTPAARTGIFQWRANCQNPNCPTGVTPGSIQSLDLLGSAGLPIDPAMAALLGQVPKTINNLSIGDGLNTGGYSFNQRDDRTRDNTSIRLDWNPAPQHSFSGTYAWNRDLLDRPGASLGLPNTYSAIPVAYNNDKENFLSAAWRWSPNSNFTNEVRFGFDLAPINFLTNQKFGAFTVSNTLFNNPDQNEFPSSRKTHTWSWQDNASWSRGNHTLSFGMQVQRVTVFAQNFYNTVPNLDLSGNFILGSGDFGGSNDISDLDLATANQLLNTLGGLVGSELQTFNVTSQTSGYVRGAPAAQNFRYDDWSLYAGDSWKFRRNLTFTYGVRWEYMSPFDERDGLMQFPVVPVGQTVQQTLLSDATLAYFGGNSGRSVYKKDLNNFAPSIGIAWDPFGDGRTSIRAGYSINYVNDELIGAPYNASLSNPGVSVQTGSSIYSGTLDYGTNASSAPTIPLPTMSDTFSGNFINLYNYSTGISYGYAVDPNLRTPYVQQWNLSIQREIGWNSEITLSYVGNKGTKLYRAIDLNQVQINGNGFLQAFNAARQNGFLAQAQPGGTFDPSYNSSIPGSQPVDYFNNNFLFGDLGAYYPGLVDQYLQQGAVGELANLYHSIGSDSSELYSYYYGSGAVAPVSLAPNQYLEAADLLGNDSSSSYNAGSIEFRRRFHSGLNLQASYTFSKVFTDYSADTASGVQRFYPYLDNAQPGLERARANFDLTHAFKANFRFALPFGEGHAWSPSNRVLSQLVSGWTTSSIFTWQSGAPFSILSGVGTLNRTFRSLLSNTAYTTSTPQQIAGQLGTYQSNGEMLLINPKYVGTDGRGAPNDALTCTPLVSGGFCNPQPGTVGNLPRNAFNGPAFFNWDLAILKAFPITESKMLEFRLEMFNAPNHPTFAVGDPNFAVSTSGASPSDMYINDPKFGVATSTASNPRIIQIGLRFAF
jgi:Carboxypeptidase regulatory-like domain